MTLILSLCTPAYVIQLSDRLVTLLREQRAHDTKANKCIVYRSRNALVSIGYAGIAYLDGVPTDQWIAQKLTGREFGSMSVRYSVATQMGRNSSNRTIDQALYQLRTTLDAHPAPKKYGLWISICGWKQVGRRTFPFITEMEWNSHSKRVTLTQTEPPWLSDMPISISSIGIDVGGDVKAQIDAHRAQNTTSRLTAETSETILLSVLRQAALKHSTVGSHAVSVVLPHPSLNAARCRFVPAKDHYARLVSPTVDITLAVSHSPWVISSNLISPPQLFLGAQVFNLNGIGFELIGTGGQQGIHGLSTGMLRRPPPR